MSDNEELAALAEQGEAAATPAKAGSEAGAGQESDEKPEGAAAEGGGNDDADGADAEKVSASKRRRERRKAEEKRRLAEAARLKKALDEAQAELERIRKKGDKEGDAPPRSEDFESEADYQAALTAYHVQKALAEEKAREVEARIEGVKAEERRIAEAAQAEVAANWVRQIEAGKARYPDFEAKVFSDANTIPKGVAMVIAGLDNAADVAYHVAGDPALQAELAGLPVEMAAVEIGRLSVRLAGRKPKVKSSAPEPVEPGTSLAAGGKDPSTMTVAEYKKWRAAGGVPT